MRTEVSLRIVPLNDRIFINGREVVATDPLSENKELLAFNDFYVSDETGVKRKGIKTVEIVVE